MVFSYHSTLFAFEISIDTVAADNDRKWSEHIGEELANKSGGVDALSLTHLELEVHAALIAVNLTRLYDVHCLAVDMHPRILALARLDELGCHLQLVEVLHFVVGV